MCRFCIHTLDILTTTIAAWNSAICKYSVERENNIENEMLYNSIVAKYVTNQKVKYSIPLNQLTS